MTPLNLSDLDGLPAETLIQQGLEDAVAGRETVGALLLQIGAPRLRLLGISLPIQECEAGNAERRLYDYLAARHGPGAHSQYNSLIRQLVSFERALERRVWARVRLHAADTANPDRARHPST